MASVICQRKMQFPIPILDSNPPNPIEDPISIHFQSNAERCIARHMGGQLWWSGIRHLPVKMRFPIPIPSSIPIPIPIHPYPTQFQFQSHPHLLIPIPIPTHPYPTPIPPNPNPPHPHPRPSHPPTPLETPRIRHPPRSSQLLPPLTPPPKGSARRFLLRDPPSIGL